MQQRTGALLALLASTALIASCSRSPTAESICHQLEKEQIAEACREGAPPNFSVPRHGAQWTFMLAEGKETVDPILGKIPKPSGGIIEFESVADRDVAVEYVNGQNKVLPFFPFVHRLEKPPMLVLMPKHETSARTKGLLERLYGYDR
jgi:hypothetical protein